VKFFKSIRFQLTARYMAVTALVLLTFAGTAYFMLSHNLYQNLDESLQSSMGEVQSSITLDNGQLGFSAKITELALVYGPDGKMVQQLGPAVEFNNIGSLVSGALYGKSAFRTVASSDSQQVRLLAAPFTVGGQRFAIVVGNLTAAVKSQLASFVKVLGYSALAVLVLVGLGIFLLSSRVFRPVEKIIRTALSIGESDLNKRINVSGDDEIGRLASTLNGMIERLEVAFDRQRQFTSDASHELRTPLAVIQAESTLALEKPRSPEEYRQSLETVSHEVNFMTGVIDKLLLLARSENSKDQPLVAEPIDLNRLVDEITSALSPLAEEKQLDVRVITHADLNVKGDRIKIRQLFLNILENAIKYTPHGGNILIKCERSAGSAVVSIKDSGIGIPEEHLPHIFQRFYRVDKARSRDQGGTGLGLAIAKSIAESHGGRIEVESQAGQGSNFRVILPVFTGNPEPVISPVAEMPA
jgi:two-component system, OmpR family, sensor histidine kinase ArlS